MSSSRSQRSRNTSENSGSIKRIALLAVGFGCMLILFWFSLSVFQGYRAIRSLEVKALRLETIAFEATRADGYNNLDLAEIETLVFGVREDISQLKRIAGPFVRLAPAFSWIPGSGRILEDLPELNDMADGGSLAAVEIFQALRPVIRIMQEPVSTPETPLPEMLQAIEEVESSLWNAAAAVDRLVEARLALQNPASLPWRLQEAITVLDRYLPLAQDGLRIATILPHLMGSHGRKVYLILAQNEDELRPTGGFISGAGVVTIENGRILAVDFANANDVDDWQNKPYGLPPMPYQEFMGMDMFLFRDANFWPDFPTSAEQAMSLFTYGQGIGLDGVIAIDQYFMQILLEALGAVTVPELNKTITADNVVDEMRAEWGPTAGQNIVEWISQRKAFMGPLANAIRLRLEGGLPPSTLVNLARVVEEAARQGHLQVYIPDPEIAAVLAATDWDGRQLNRAGQDFLNIIETNMGFNKAAAGINRQIAYHVTLEEDGGGQANLALNLTHGSPAVGKECRHGAGYQEDTNYADLIGDCYWVYLRVYAPLGSQLIDASQHPLPSDSLLSGRSWSGQARTLTDQPDQFAVFDNFMVVEPGTQQSGYFTYLLPTTITRNRGSSRLYRLEIDKQAGLDTQTLEVKVTLPYGKRMINSIPFPDLISGQDLYYNSQQGSDFDLMLEYR